MEERSFTFTITQNHLGIIGAALRELPYKLSAPVLDSLEAQLQAQQAPPPAPPASQELRDAVLQAVEKEAKELDASVQEQKAG